MNLKKGIKGIRQKTESDLFLFLLTLFAWKWSWWKMKHIYGKTFMKRTCTQSTADFTLTVSKSYECPFYM